MTEQQQYPTREQIEKVVDDAIGKWWDEGALLSSLRPAVLDAVLALFPQPTPSAEEARGAELARLNAPTGAPWDSALTESDLVPEPEYRVADMAPNTVFTARIKGEPENRWARLGGAGVYVMNARRQVRGGWLIDPSTIRDVTPPPA